MSRGAGADGGEEETSCGAGEIGEGAGEIIEALVFGEDGWMP